MLPLRHRDRRALFITDAAERPKGAAIVPHVLRGYPLAFLLAFMLVFLAVVGIARKVRSLARRWTDAHIPIVVRPGGYDRVVADLEEALDQAGLAVDRRPAPKVMSDAGEARRARRRRRASAASCPTT